MFAFTQPPAAGLCQAGAASLVPQHSPELAACQLVCLQSAGPRVGQPLLSPGRATGSCRLMGGSSKLCSRDAFVDCHRGPQSLSPPPVEKTEAQTTDQALTKLHSKRVAGLGVKPCPFPLCPLWLHVVPLCLAVHITRPCPQPCPPPCTGWRVL